MGHESIFVGDMDTCWKWDKACDTGVTPSGLWMLGGSGATPEKCTMTCILNIIDVSLLFYYLHLPLSIYHEIWV
jgi:hypothetical protein